MKDTLALVGETGLTSGPVFVAFPPTSVRDSTFVPGQHADCPTLLWLPEVRSAPPLFVFAMILGG